MCAVQCCGFHVACNFNPAFRAAFHLQISFRFGLIRGDMSRNILLWSLPLLAIAVASKSLPLEPLTKFRTFLLCTRMCLGDELHASCRAARMRAGQPECPECLSGSQNACQAARMAAGRPEWLRGSQRGQNACRALAVACQWPLAGRPECVPGPGSGLPVAWQWPGSGPAVALQPGSGWSGEVGRTFEAAGR